MNTILKIAVGAAIAGAVVAVVMKQRSAKAKLPDAPSTAGQGRVPSGSDGYTLEELASENKEWGGGSSGLNA